MKRSNTSTGRSETKNIRRRHCEPTGPARSGRPNARLREAIERPRIEDLDCFVACAPRNDEAQNNVGWSSDLLIFFGFAAVAGSCAVLADAGMISAAESFATRLTAGETG